MQIIQIEVTAKRAKALDAPVLVCNNTGYSIKFTFDDEWADAEAKTARFVYNKDGKVVHKDVPFTGDTVEIPPLSNTREVRVGVYVDELITTTSAYIPCEPSILCHGGTPEEPTPEPGADETSVVIPASFNELGLLGKAVGLILGNEYTVVIDILENDGATRQETETAKAYQTTIEGFGEIEGSVALGTYEDDYYDYMLYDFCNVSAESVPMFDANNCIYQTGGKVTQVTITGIFAK